MPQRFIANVSVVYHALEALARTLPPPRPRLPPARRRIAVAVDAGARATKARIDEGLERGRTFVRRWRAGGRAGDEFAYGGAVCERAALLEEMRAPAFAEGDEEGLDSTSAGAGAAAADAGAPPPLELLDAGAGAGARADSSVNGRPCVAWVTRGGRAPAPNGASRQVVLVDEATGFPLRVTDERWVADPPGGAEEASEADEDEDEDDDEDADAEGDEGDELSALDWDRSTPAEGAFDAEAATLAGAWEAVTSYTFDDLLVFPDDAAFDEPDERRALEAALEIDEPWARGRTGARALEAARAACERNTGGWPSIFAFHTFLSV